MAKARGGDLCHGTSSYVMRNKVEQLGTIAVGAALALGLFSTPAARAAGFTLVNPMSTPRSDHTATLLPSGKVLVAGGPHSGLYLAGAELYDPATGQWTATGTMNRGRAFHTATLLMNGKVLVAGGDVSLDAVTNSAEIYDPASGTWTLTGGMNVARQYHTATLLPSGKVLVTGGANGSDLSNNSTEVFDLATGVWTPAGAMASAHQHHTATLLPSGKVLIVGGYSTNSYPMVAELYDPSTGSWRTTGSALNPTTTYHTATLLPNGKVLVAGGDNSIFGGSVASAYLYDPTAETWTAVATMHSSREDHIATLLPNGKVLVAGGYLSGSGVIATAELYDPTSSTWTTLSSMNIAREYHTATMLCSGRVLIAGGDSSGTAEIFDYATPSWTLTPALTNGTYQQTANLLPNGKVLLAEYSNGALYDSVSGTWSYTPLMNSPRVGHTGNLMPNGKVLIAGGIDTLHTLSPTNAAEVYDPALGTWTTVAPMNNARSTTLSVLLPSGKVLVAGGSTANPGSSELYDPASGTWTVTGYMNVDRTASSITLLPNGKVLVAGGYHPYNGLSSAELYDPVTGVWTYTGSMAAIHDQHTATLLPNGKVLVAGGSANSAQSAELYDPATGTWTVTGPMKINRYYHTATLLPNGQVLVAGGESTSGVATNTAELYDPASGTWTYTASLNVGRDNHTATLLPNGKVLAAGGFDPSNLVLASAELYDSGLGYSSAWQPVIATVSPLSPGNSVLITGSLFRGVSEGSGGGTQDSPADYPLVQLRSIDSGQTLFLTPTNWSTNSFASAPLSGFAPGNVEVTVFVNGIPSQPSTLSLTQSLATVTLGNLTQAYDGTAKSVSVTTAPPGLSVLVTYNGSASAPTNVGSYTTIGTIDDLNYQGGATNTLVITKGAAVVTLSNLSQTYTGMARSVSVSTSPTNLAVSVTYDGSPNAPTNAGSYTVIGIVNDPNYQGAATNTLVVGKATAALFLVNLSQTYDGTARVVSANTAPTNLAVIITYNGSLNAPTNVGSYTIIGTVNDPDYMASATNTLVVSRAPGTVTLGNISQPYDGTPKSVSVTTSPTNLTVTVTYQPGGGGGSGPPTKVGSYTVIGTITDPNYIGSATNTLVFTKGNATVTLGNFTQAYDGTAKSVSVITSPTNLAAAVTYNGLASAPTNVGSYTVIGTVTDTNYIGSATNTLIVTKGPAIVTLGNLSQTYDGTPKSVTVTTVPTNLTVSVTYNGFSFPPPYVGSYTVIGTVVDTNYQGSATNTLVINKGTASVTLSNLVQTFDGTAKSVSVTTTPSGLTVFVTYNGSPSAPNNTGSYSVIATVIDANYQGGATNTLVITGPPVAVHLASPTKLANGAFQFGFSNTPGASFSALAATNVTLPVSNWSVLGSVTEISSGNYQFTDPQATNNARRFYRVRSP